MKKYVLLTALALVIAAPAYAQTANETNVKRTLTAVEKAAVEQGFSPANPGAMNNDAGMAPAPEFEPAAPAAAAAPAAPRVYSNTDTGVSADMAPTAAGASPTLSPDVMPTGAAAAPGGNRPSLVTTGENGLPKGLVMNGPGTAEYKRKHRAKKKKKAAVEQAAPVEAGVASPEVKPEPVSEPVAAPVAEPVMEAPPAMPEPTPVAPVEAAPTPAPMAAPVTPEPAPAELQPSPGPDPLAAPADPFAPQQ